MACLRFSRVIFISPSINRDAANDDHNDIIIVNIMPFSLFKDIICPNMPNSNIGNKP